MTKRFDLSHWKLFKSKLQTLALLLLLSYAASFGARWHWALDLFSHFSWQYALGGILILAGLLLVRSWKCAALIALLTICNVFEIYRHADFSRTAATAPAITVVHYNRHINRTDQTTFKEWLTENVEFFDIVVIQEAGSPIEKMATELESLYPYQILKPRDHAFGMVVLSRYAFTDVEHITFPELAFDNFALRLVLQHPQFKQPVIFYALHALPPIGGDAWAQRNTELAKVARQVGYDPAPHRIMLGDWNVTPYSPFFTDVIKDSGLTWKIGGLMPTPTWPTIGLPWLMQIKIDHILSSPSLALVETYTGHPTNSDHYAVIARFAEK